MDTLNRRPLPSTFLPIGHSYSLHQNWYDPYNLSKWLAAGWAAGVLKASDYGTLQLILLDFCTLSSCSKQNTTFLFPSANSSSFRNVVFYSEHWDDGQVQKQSNINWGSIPARNQDFSPRCHFKTGSVVHTVNAGGSLYGIKTAGVLMWQFIFM